ncbi:MAG: hypothetical protein ACI9OJ_001598 [Myxococcota bacterium]|jgi:hypothetical protein
MFNVKVSLLYFLLIVLSVVGITVTVGEGKNEAIRQAENTLRSMPGVFEIHKNLREKRLRDVANRIGGSELRAQLRTLRDFRGEFIQVDQYICSPDTGVLCDLSHPSFSAERARIAEEQYGTTTFNSFASKLFERVKLHHPEWDDAAKSNFVSDTKKRLKDCFGRGSTQCDWQFAYDSLQSVLGDLKREEGHVGPGVGLPDLVLVFDSQGIGLANGQNDAWSYRREYVDLVAELRQFVSRQGAGAQRPIYYTLLSLRETGETEFLVGLVPVVDDDGTFLGAVMAGESISGRMVEAEKALFEKDVTYILDDKPLASTLDREEYKFTLASTKKANRLKVHLVSNPTWLGISVPYYSDGAGTARSPDLEAAGPTFVGGVAYGKKYQTLRVVLATERASWVGPLGTLQAVVPLFGFGIFVVGVILFWLLIRNHTKPYERIDAGIHEVINGNFDYEFPFDYSEELPSSMAQSLNLMMAVLLGKPLPEDEDTSSQSGWDGSGLGPEIRAAGPRPSDLVIETRPDKTPPPDFLQAPAESYYKQLYDAYQQAVNAEEEAESITYVRFVEQLVRNERQLKSSLGCKNVRFKVVDRNGQVVLVPVPVS